MFRTNRRNPKPAQLLFQSLELIVIFLVAAATASAQQIQGQVRYAESGQPVLNALVECNGPGGNSQQFTDRDGKFFFRVSPGHYTVYVQLAGYKREQQSYDLTDTGSSEYWLVRLKPDISVTHTKLSVDVPPAARAEFEQAEMALAGNRKENLNEGVRHLEKATAIYPSFVEAELRLGTTYMDLQQWDKAELALKKTIEIDPKAANAYFALGEIYRRQKKYDQSEKTLQDGLAIESHSAQAHLTLARVYWERVAGVKEDAQWRPSLEKSYQEVKLALDLDPNLANAHLLKGDLYFKVHRAEDALKEFDEYLRLEPKGEFAPQTRELADKIRKALAQTKKP
jgi:tetratricopeptide (TPR) repeat protein